MKIKDERGYIIDVSEEEALQRLRKRNAEDIANLEAKLAEKDELLKQKIGDMKSTDFIKMCISCGFMVEAKENDNQTAIDELEKVKEYISKGLAFDVDVQIWFEDYIDQQITELKGEK